MCSIQFECCPSITVTLGPIKNSLIILSLYLSTVFQSFRAGEKGYYVTMLVVIKLIVLLIIHASSEVPCDHSCAVSPETLLLSQGK